LTELTLGILSEKHIGMAPIKISAALLNLQCQVLQNFHLTEIAISDGLWHRHCILFPAFDDLNSMQI